MSVPVVRSGAPAAQDGAPALILVVDDNPTNRYVLTTSLRRAGHDVVEAPDGTAALDLLAATGELPEAAIVDVRLPDMTGFEVCEHIKAEPRTAGLPVIHISASAISVDDRTQGLNRGADAYLTEPIAPDELLATVSATLRYTRARRRAESLARRLVQLNSTTLALYSATEAGTLVRAAAEGAAAILATTAAAALTSPQGRHLRAVRGSGTATHVRDTAALPVGTEGDTPYEALNGHSLRYRTGAAVDVMNAADLPLLAGAPDVRTPRGAPDVRTPRGVPDVRTPRGAPDVQDPRGAPDVPGARDVPDAAVREGRLAVAMARAKHGRAPVVIAVPAAAVTHDDDRDLLLQLVHATALALEALRAYSEEHALALTLQRSFLPERLPESHRARIAVRYLPASEQAEIGGDFYEALNTPSGLVVAVGDVAGHSLDAAMAMGQIRHALRAYAMDDHAPHQILDRLDRLLVTQLPGTTVTLCVIQIPAETNRLRIANAGHLPPLLRPPAGSAVYITDHGPLLGLGLEHPPPVEVDVAPDTDVLLVTDGLIERRGTDLQASLDDLAKALTEAPRDTERICDTLLARFPLDGTDDVALMALRVLPLAP
ncbi:SpoIIE family protein phosphatase [Streptomyces sp. NPDC026672]|uniref:SpoIIE family protein phosphatase n=1 Tax=unclassified Streptomyces TaxID=2593676 RepID=UPI0033CE2415